MSRARVSIPDDQSPLHVFCDFQNPELITRSVMATLLRVKILPWTEEPPLLPTSPTSRVTYFSGGSFAL